jgi:tryptophan 2,3-dioxygenase
MAAKAGSDSGNSSSPVTPPRDYGDYLQLDKLLSAQSPWSEKYGRPAHDEHLFIIVHQVYELWFKEIIHNLTSVIEMFDRNFVDEVNIGIAVQRVTRINEIMKILIDQVRVLETMTPLDFLDFRNMLGAASGFQSVQFRVFENRLGLKRTQGTQQVDRASPLQFDETARSTIAQAGQERSLFEVVEQWLERTPFVHAQEFDFTKEYQAAVRKLWEGEKAVVIQNARLTPEEKERRLEHIAQSQEQFLLMVDPKEHARIQEQGQWRLSYSATLAALFISLYRDEPILHLPYRLLASLIDLDEGISSWRHRHSLLVLRMIGTKMGSGGSAGHEYLRSTVEMNRVFKDLFSLSSLLIARADLPALPAALKTKLAFHYTVLAKNEASKVSAQ